MINLLYFQETVLSVKPVSTDPGYMKTVYLLQSGYRELFT